MANPIDGGMVSPPAPVQNAGRGGGSDYNALTMAQPTQQKIIPAAPSHAHTVAALRHFSAVIGELKILAKNPDIGRVDMKSAIVDGVTSLVAERVMTPAAAVIQLASIPDNPLQQRQWLAAKTREAIDASNSVLAHHAIGHAGTLDWNIEKQHPEYDRDNHHQTMDGLSSHYRQ